MRLAGFNNHCNTALRNVAPPGRSFDGVGSEGTLQAGHVALLFSANQIRGLKSVRQIIEVRYSPPDYPGAWKINKSTFNGVFRCFKNSIRRSQEFISRLSISPHNLDSISLIYFTEDSSRRSS